LNYSSKGEGDTQSDDSDVNDPETIDSNIAEFKGCEVVGLIMLNPHACRRMRRSLVVMVCA